MWKRGGVEERGGREGGGREGVEERGQGCFLFTQLIDTLMSAVGFVVALKLSGSLFPSKNNQRTPPTKENPNQRTPPACRKLEFVCLH